MSTARVALFRELAAELDGQAYTARLRCRCPIHKVLAEEYDRIATSYRQRALEETLRPAREPGHA